MLFIRHLLCGIFLLLSIFTLSCDSQREKWASHTNKSDPTRLRAEVLKCFECDSGGTAPGYCTGESHVGKEVFCPAEGTVRDITLKNDTSWKCWIMKVYSVTTRRVQVYKGCENIGYHFGADLKPSHEKDGCMNRSTILPTFPGGSFVVTMCFCETNNCNKDTIEGVGQEDIEQRIKLRERNNMASPRLSGHVHLVIVWLPIICCAAVGRIFLA